MTLDNSTGKKTTTELARERSSEASERTLMAWIRTSLSLIGFGFGIGKLQDYFEMSNRGQVHDPIHGTRIFSGAFIALGILALVVAAIQHQRKLNQIKQDVFVYSTPFPLPKVVALLLLLIGLFGLVHLLL